MAPVLFLIFNRPEHTARVFERIRIAKPERLFVHADGPRNTSDVIPCGNARDASEKVDWTCDVRRLYRVDNGGVRHGVNSALDWFFGQVEEGIIVEDDVLPDPTFFQYCDELLARYRTEEKIGWIGGFDPQYGTLPSPESYRFTRFGHIWGWASWRRVWAQHDKAMTYWPMARYSVADPFYRNFGEIAFSNSGWDMPFAMGCLIRGQMSISPQSNLTSNIGFDGSGVGCQGVPDYVVKMNSNAPTFPMRFPLTHPVSIDVEDAAEDFSLAICHEAWSDVAAESIRRCQRISV